MLNLPAKLGSDNWIVFIGDTRVRVLDERRELGVFICSYWARATTESPAISITNGIVLLIRHFIFNFSIVTTRKLNISTILYYTNNKVMEKVFRKKTVILH
jgi:hypothetical protein